MAYTRLVARNLIDPFYRSRHGLVPRQSADFESSHLEALTNVGLGEHWANRRDHVRHVSSHEAEREADDTYQADALEFRIPIALHTTRNGGFPKGASIFAQRRSDGYGRLSPCVFAGINRCSDNRSTVVNISFATSSAVSAITPRQT